MGVLFEFLRTLTNARGETNRSHLVVATNWLDLTGRPYKLVPIEVCCVASLARLSLVPIEVQTCPETDLSPLFPFLPVCMCVCVCTCE